MAEKQECKYHTRNLRAEWKMPESELAQDKQGTSTGQVPDKSPDKLPDKLPDKSPDKFDTNNLYIRKLITIIGRDKFSIKEMMSEAGLKNRENFMEVYLNPAIKDKFVRLLYPKSPRHPRQKYMLTVKGLALYNELTKGE
ncbi:MAG: hypothetical protein IK025_08310 [Bacteroidales bacterium]|nr:hypothetical protein [Bacteroidales bacterium]